MPSESTRHGAETKPLWPGGITLCACFTSAAAGRRPRAGSSAAMASPLLIVRA